MVNGAESCRKSVISLRILTNDIIALNYYDVNISKYGVIYGTTLGFWESKGWITSIYPYGWFLWYLCYWLSRRSLDDKRQIPRWNDTVSRFKGEFVQMTNDVNSSFDDYSISPVIRKVLLHSGY